MSKEQSWTLATLLASLPKTYAHPAWVPDIYHQLENEGYVTIANSESGRVVVSRKEEKP